MRWLRTETPLYDDDAELEHGTPPPTWVPFVFDLGAVVAYADHDECTLVILRDAGAHIIRIGFALFAGAMKAYHYEPDE